jgi:hypothetical protein
VSIKGSPYARFRRALDTGDLGLIRGAARELPQVGLDDALTICLVVPNQEPQLYERSALRWLARFATRPATRLGQVREAAAAFELMRLDADRAVTTLRRLARERRVA